MLPVSLTDKQNNLTGLPGAFNNVSAAAEIGDGLAGEVA